MLLLVWMTMLGDKGIDSQQTGPLRRLHGECTCLLTLLVVAACRQTAGAMLKGLASCCLLPVCLKAGIAGVLGRGFCELLPAAGFAHQQGSPTPGLFHAAQHCLCLTSDGTPQDAAGGLRFW
jgi:hypothetical protein